MLKVLSVSLSILLFNLPAFGQAKKKIGVVWSGKSGMTKRVMKGFDERIKEVAPDLQIQYDKELKDMDALAKVVGQYQSSKLDGMLVLRSTGAKYLGKNPPSIPAFIGGCNHPTPLGAVKNINSPEGNITGVSYFLEYETPFEIFQAINPKMKNILFVLEDGHPSSDVDQMESEKLCAKNKYTCTFKRIKGEGDVKGLIDSHRSKIDTIIMGNQAKVFDNVKSVIAAAKNIPVLSFSDKPVVDGALVGFVADDHKLGRMLADSVKSVVIDGKKISDVPIKFDPKPKFKINEKAISKLNLKVPYVILKEATIVN